MATGTGKVYTRTISNVFGGADAGDSYSSDFLSNTIKVALMAATYTPNQNTDELWSAISSNELANGNGYTTGGETLGSKTVTEGTNSVIFDTTATTVWTATGGDIGPASYAVVYDSTTGILLSYIDFSGSPQTATDGNTLTITWDATNGVFKGTTS